MIVVSDESPLLALAQADSLYLLKVGLGATRRNPTIRGRCKLSGYAALTRSTHYPLPTEIGRGTAGKPLAPRPVGP